MSPDLRRLARAADAGTGGGVSEGAPGRARECARVAQHAARCEADLRFAAALAERAETLPAPDAAPAALLARIHATRHTAAGAGAVSAGATEAGVVSVAPAPSTPRRTRRPRGSPLGNPLGRLTLGAERGTGSSTATPREAAGRYSPETWVAD